jgi:Xaa-Pro aminopeptidase
MERTAKVIFSDTHRDANMLYWAGISVTDPFLAIECEHRRTAVIHTLERDRLKQHSRFHEVFLWEDYLSSQELSRPIFEKVVRVLSLFQEKDHISQWHIPSYFPSAILILLQKHHLSFEVLPDPFLPERVLKKEPEVGELRHAAHITSEAMESARQIITQSQVAPDHTLSFQGNPLTAEFLKNHIELFCFQQGALAENTIVACGPQSASPHEEGHGVLYAHRPIVIDIFPRLKSSGYFGDMTRTYVKGDPSPQQQKLYDCVLEAHHQSILRLRDGVSAGDIHDRNVAFFEEQGFLTHSSPEGCTGFIHGTGHGVGLDIHEEPRLSHKAGQLSRGMVLTVEPGLYYPDGGVRIEDTLLVRDKDAESLTHGSYNWTL